MKKLNAVLLAGLLSLGAVAGLASCGPTSQPTETPTTSVEEPTTSVPTTSVDPTTDPTTAPTSEPTVPVKSPERFETVNMEGSILVGESVDFAEKITVVYADGTKDHDFTISEGDGYVINGTVVTFEEPGDYNILVKAGSKSMRYKVKVETENRRLFDAWFSSIDQNYSVFNVTLDGTGMLTPQGFSYHCDNEYFGMYFNERLQNLTAKLSDGYYYDGEFSNVTSMTTFDLKFNPGHANWNNSYGSVSLSYGLDSSMFESVYEDGEEYFTGDASVCETFLNFTCALTYQGSGLGLEFWGFVDEDNTAGLFAAAVQDGEEVAYDLWLIADVGETHVKTIEDYQATGALPATVPSSKLDAALNSRAIGHNYTMVAQSMFVDMSGNYIEDETEIADPDTGFFAYEFFKSTQVTYVTEDAIVVTPDGINPVIGYSAQEDGTYLFGYGEDASGNAVPVAIPEEDALWENEGALSLTIPSAKPSTIEFTTYQEIPGTSYEYFAGSAGTAVFDAATEQPLTVTNQFTHQLLNSLICFNSLYEGYGVGDVFCALPMLSTASDPDHVYALSEYLDVSFIYDSATDALQIGVLLPLYQMARWGFFGQGADQYMVGVYGVEIQIQYVEVGTTVTPDISAFFATAE